jgi:NAD(P) transhydrogenase subunit alpha
MILGVPKETAAGEQRIALVPECIPALTKAGLTVLVQAGGGAAAGFADESYAGQGARLQDDVIAAADVLLKVRPPTSEEVGRMKEGAVLIGLLQPYSDAARLGALAARRVAAFALELMPRIARAQPMDVLSSMSTVAGYKAVLLAANRLPRFFPLLMTAAGTIAPARVLVLGAGVAGLQAIGTARRLGAAVEAYDTRPAVQEQVESLGAKFLDLGLQPAEVEAATGYAAAQPEQFYERQRERLAKWVAAADVVVATALVPGRRAPVLISADMVQAMCPGSVIVDVAAEVGGNCALTEPGREVIAHGVVILGPVNLPSSMAYHASQMYARNATAYLFHLLEQGKVRLDLTDELTRAPLVTHGGEVLYERPRP